MASEIVRIEGITELTRALKRMDKDLAKEFRAESKGIGDDVAKDAREKVPTASGKARSSIRSGVTAKGSYVAGGKDTVPYYGWLDFGSRDPVSGRTRSEGPWRGSGKGPRRGRFIYPAIDHNRRTIIQRSEKAVASAKRKAGL